MRVSYAWDDVNNKLKTVNEDHYYPFGLQHNGYNKPSKDITGGIGEVEIGIGLGTSSGSANYKYKYNGKEMQEELNLNTYAYGWRDYDPAIGRWNVIDQLSEKYHTTSPYAFVQNNPIINREIDGRYFDDKKSARQANKIEKRAEKQANKLDKQANKIDKNGGDSGDLRARSGELRKSAQDVRDMRNDKSTEYKYAKLDGKEGKTLGLKGPSTTLTGQNGKGDNVVTMFTEKNMGNQIHETRHGGQNARGEFNVATGAGYGVADEVSAYRAQYSWDGQLQYRDQPSQPVMLQRMMRGQDPTIGTITNINQINGTIVNSMVDPGFIPIYPPPSIPLNIWNNN